MSAIFSLSPAKNLILTYFGYQVSQIEEKMKNGYYVSHGLRSVKEDISRMCREAIKYDFFFLCLSGFF